MSVGSRNFTNALCRARKRLDQFAIISSSAHLLS
jgi:hypothetical protein